MKGTEMKHRSYAGRPRLFRSSTDRMLLGVCGGLAEHFDFSPAGVRLLAVILFIFSGFFPLILLYIVLGVILPPAPLRPAFESEQEEELWDLYHVSRGAAMGKLRQRFQALDRRLQRIESIVTSPEFELEEEYRRL